MTPLKVMHLPLRDTLADYAKDEVDQRIHRIALLLRPEAGITHSGRRPSKGPRARKMASAAHSTAPEREVARKNRPAQARQSKPVALRSTLARLKKQWRLQPALRR
jgi:hypothetical protein